MRKRKAKSEAGEVVRSAGKPAGTAGASGIDALAAQLAAYLPPEQVERVRGAYAVGAHAHAAQRRKSGEPYITHPLAVATILAGLRLDAETIIAAILHDTLEDTGMTRVQLEASFGPVVTELVDGVTKLERVDFASRLEADAESFRKMLLAMARDLRVILIKLADRLHNMRTLSAMPPDARRRIARETLEIYAPIAARLGMNAIRAELQDLGFRSLYPDRYKIIASRIKRTLGNRREAMDKIEHALAQRLAADGIPVRIISRIKAPYSIWSKMKGEHKTFDEVMDVYGFRLVTDSVAHCYQALGTAHSLFKPVEKRFKDFIAIPKANGYQSLHTVLFGPFGAPIEIQIRTEEMDAVAERGVAAHWSYKQEAIPSNSAQSRARAWVAGLADSQAATPSSLEFIENVKVDLFPDEVYLFTPAGDIQALPKNATALDLAFAVHTDVGMHAVAARVDGKLASLRSQPASGQTVEVITAPSAVPNPSWLDFAVTGKARAAIRQYLKHLQHEDAIDFGHRMLESALDAGGSSLDAIPPEALDRYLADNNLRRLEDLLSEIALGNRMPDQVALKLVELGGSVIGAAQHRAEKIRISGAERGILSFGQCCHPVPGDDIVGYLSPGKGIVVHRVECPNVAELSKLPERRVEIGWDSEVQGDYRVELRVEVVNRPGVLATVSSAIADANSNIDDVKYIERGIQAATLIFAIEVKHRKHLADVMRRIRNTKVVNGVYRYPL
ncbi:MAG: bifunctional (p)ppGpp synthetase/guanosine-3',5'-bis(diphosphate) 3'-pyrophosphohydrolase [Rhodanobacteraceae bacterium]|nr:MAG: bifunctional (p)ppGpp synthetase/guanosine-3',5'-bis(diphosphate) 3'-pyrophosphohydrolase [Rhodanobacteraceae bacterium]